VLAWCARGQHADDDGAVAEGACYSDIVPEPWAHHSQVFVAVWQVRGDCFADDVDIPPEAVAWVPSEAIDFFESGGVTLPSIAAGFEGAEIHAYYEINQKRVEDFGTDDMLAALSSALFKTTGDEQFKVEEKKPEPEPGYGTMKRGEQVEFENKYKVRQLGELGTSTENKDDCM
jgi:hypothetical protein